MCWAQMPAMMQCGGLAQVCSRGSRGREVGGGGEGREGGRDDACSALSVTCCDVTTELGDGLVERFDSNRRLVVAQLRHEAA